MLSAECTAGPQLVLEIRDEDIHPVLKSLRVSWGKQIHYGYKAVGQNCVPGAMAESGRSTSHSLRGLGENFQEGWYLKEKKVTRWMREARFWAVKKQMEHRENAVRSQNASSYVGLESLVHESKVAGKARESLWYLVSWCKYLLPYQPFCTEGS